MLARSSLSIGRLLTQPTAFNRLYFVQVASLVFYPTPARARPVSAGLVSDKLENVVLVLNLAGNSVGILSPQVLLGRGQSIAIGLSQPIKERDLQLEY